jgi:hypothetical protein
LRSSWINAALTITTSIDTDGQRPFPNLHRLLADDYWKDGVFTMFSAVDLNAIEPGLILRLLLGLILSGA